MPFFVASLLPQSPALLQPPHALTVHVSFYFKFVMVYPLSGVLAVAKRHCFYDESVTYPPNVDAIDEIIRQSTADDEAEKLAAWPLLHKKTL